MSPSTRRPNQPSIQVICQGLSHTGTVSLMEALEILGHGPCYHTIKWVQSRPSDFHRWVERAEDKTTARVANGRLQGGACEA
ncbi:hypothetical protein M422DRAFT_264361 [Sphaerobolus stellatus SS14]|uniref:Unplaced genomic scaffold SPHSTscaffold_135, whole genome shotgun sequence n=1 Tax=Sphaerobolus stellatus (strain SS14) TaxID=990650 RepID=A0A0C9UFN1_SPHS4|nr:hypothetical protein M422DRAFT_264361 [Sphaerobolus stellatus SS14]